MRLSHLAGFKNVQELLDYHDRPLSNEGHMKLDQDRTINETMDEEEEEPQRCLNIKTLREVFSLIEPNLARSATPAYGVQQSIKVYKEIYEAKKRQAKQTTISSFYKSCCSPTTSPSPTNTRSPYP